VGLVRPALQVSPTTNIVASGTQGEAFSPASFQYQLTSTIGSVNYLISGIPTWLNANFTSGTATTTPVTVTFSLINPGSLSPGTYTATISITNTSNGQGNTTLTATLAVNAGSSTQIPCPFTMQNIQPAAPGGLMINFAFTKGITAFGFTEETNLTPPPPATAANPNPSHIDQVDNVTVLGYVYRQDLNMSGSFTLNFVFDDQTYCVFDPLVTKLIINTGHSVIQTFKNIGAAEHFISVTNGVPGLKDLIIRINGRNFKKLDLAEPVINVDVGSVMTMKNNTISFIGGGDVGAFANIEVGDTRPAVKSRLTAPIAAAGKAQIVGTWGRLAVSLGERQ
jgi:hypothetical protein